MRGTLEGHEGWVTAIATPMSQPNSDILLSASRDKTVILWKLTRDEVSSSFHRDDVCVWGWGGFPLLDPPEARLFSVSFSSDNPRRALFSLVCVLSLSPPALFSDLARRSLTDTHSGA